MFHGQQHDKISALGETVQEAKTRDESKHRAVQAAPDDETRSFHQPCRREDQVVRRRSTRSRRECEGRGSVGQQKQRPVVRGVRGREKRNAKLRRRERCQHATRGSRSRCSKNNTESLLGKGNNFVACLFFICCYCCSFVLTLVMHVKHPATGNWSSG